MHGHTHTHTERRQCWKKAANETGREIIHDEYDQNRIYIYIYMWKMSKQNISES